MLCTLLLPSPFTLIIPPIPRSFLTARECLDFIIQPCRMLPFVLRKAVPDREEDMEVDTKIDMEEVMEIDGEDPGEGKMDVDVDVDVDEEEEMDVDVTKEEEMDVDMEEYIEDMDID
ncbi:ribosomal RNA processing protein 1 homolog [Passer domesticus]|uniref:ribosomal RNA processing protein 1 homolog n=1 Tax=Passer domesticus TaxID=48849 RepID=UPI0030FF3105